MKYLIFLAMLAVVSCVPSATSTKTTATNNGGTTSSGTNSGSTETPVGTDDPLASYAWHLENTAQSTFATASGISGQDIDVKEVHSQNITGAGIKIAISDTGVDLNHQDLSGNQIIGQHRDYSTDNSANWRGGNPYPIEDEAHGTAVTGLAAALGWNGIGSRGVAPNAKYGAFLFIGGFHTTESSYEAKTLDQMTGSFDIFNYSYGYLGCEFYPATSTVVSAYKTGVTSLRSGKGAIYIKAGGNDYIGANSDCDSSSSTYYLGNTNTSEDQNLPYLILTSAVNASGKISSYSTPGSGLWIASLGGEYGDDAPAMLTTDILSCSHGFAISSNTVNAFNKGGNSLNSTCNYTSLMNGTSSATPVLSGVVALMLEANPNLTWRDVKHILAVTADKINYSTATINHPSGTSSVPSGYVYDYLYVRNAAGYDFSNTYGFGRVNANRAVTMAKTYVSTLGTYLESSYATSGTLSLSIPDRSATGIQNSISVSTNYIIESVQIKITTDHTYVGDLGVELVSPSGTSSRLLLANSNIDVAGLSDFTLISNAFYGESSAGSWTIKIVDGATSDTGKLTNWKIRINGHQ